MNRKKLFVSNNSAIIKFHFRKCFNQFVWHFFEVHNLIIIWLYAFQLITCKVSADAFSLVYSKLLPAKLSRFISGATFAAYHWQFFGTVTYLIFEADFYRELLFCRFLANVCEARLRLCVVSNRFLRVMIVVKTVI